MPMKFTKDNPPSNKIADRTIGISKNSEKYPPKPKATVAPTIIEVIAVNQPIRNPINSLLNAFFTKTYSAAAFGNKAANSA